MSDEKVTVTAGNEPWVPGPFSADIVPETDRRRIHHVYFVTVGKRSAATAYELTLYHGKKDQELGKVVFETLDLTSLILPLPVATFNIPAGHRVRAKLQSKIPGASIEISLYIDRSNRPRKRKKVEVK